MKQVFSTANGIEVIEVPSPSVQPGHVMVEVDYSLVSSGTELATLSATKESGRGLAAEVASNPGLAGRLAQRVRSDGIKEAASAVRTHLEAKAGRSRRLGALGYSCSGRVVEVGEKVSQFRPGERVACAGADLATHSELVAVPENLVTPVPRDCDMKGAASVAVGSVAMQCIRRAEVRLGEHVAVIGLGLVGLISLQLLKLSGARIVGFDVSSRRVSEALRVGAHEAYDDVAELMEAVGRLTEHMGVDASLITASSEGGGPLETAMEATRMKGRVVVVGVVGMALQRDPFLRKEIDLVGSSSYGPGRYDDVYEQKGIDYPYAYVRWTERRNMSEYLRLLSEGRLELSSLAEEYPVESAVEAYDRLESATDRPAAVFISYPSGRTLHEKSRSRVDVRPARSTKKVRLGVAGAGSFVRRVHLPTLGRMKDDVELGGVLTRRGSAAVEVARQSDALYAATSYRELTSDPDTDAILIGTRHDLHAGMVLQALRAGKHVFVEKPLALNEEDLVEIEELYRTRFGEDGPPILQTGFNRRFSPYAVELKQLVQSSRTPLMMSYQMNAGFLPEDHWLRTEEGGGRNLGEACHIYDLFTFFTEARLVDVKTTCLSPPDNTHARNENFTTTLSFDDGSIGTLTFTTIGSKAHPKELLHVYADEAVYTLTEYSQLDVAGAPDLTKTTKVASKGHLEEMKAFIGAVKHGGDWPIPLWQQVQASRAAITVESQINGAA